MIEQMAVSWGIPGWLLRVVLIGVFFLVAYGIHRLRDRLATYLVGVGRLTKRGRVMRPERQATLTSLIASGISIGAFALALLLSLSLFVSATTLIWVVGLFSAAFGLGARPLVNDFLNGISFIFEDTFDVGDKVEILDVEGIVESVNLRTTMLRAPGGELFTISNGDVRVIRNFSRGRFSATKVTFKMQTTNLERALETLEELGRDAVMELPNLLEPWQVISESGMIGQETELTILAKARFGKAAEMRPRLSALVQKRLAEVDIELVG